MEFNVVPVGVEFVFGFGDFSRSEQAKLSRQLHGFETSSRGNGYSYKGILSEMKHLKPARSAIIVSTSNAKLLRQFFKKWGVSFYENLIILSDEQASKLGFEKKRGLKKFYDEVKGDDNSIITVDF